MKKKIYQYTPPPHTQELNWSTFHFERQCSLQNCRLTKIPVAGIENILSHRWDKSKRPIPQTIKGIVIALPEIEVRHYC